jgi:hypothetical protein
MSSIEHFRGGSGGGHPNNRPGARPILRSFGGASYYHSGYHGGRWPYYYWPSYYYNYPQDYYNVDQIVYPYNSGYNNDCVGVSENQVCEYPRSVKIGVDGNADGFTDKWLCCRK